MRKVTIYTDGACTGNPGPGGYGTILIHGVYRKELYGAEPHTTNNRMELLSAIVGLEALKEPCIVDLYSDSKYLVDAFNKNWLDDWQKNNWRRSNKKPVLNIGLWERLLPLTKKHTVNFHWIKGHSGNPENERCDALARYAIQSSA